MEAMKRMESIAEGLWRFIVQTSSSSTQSENIPWIISLVHVNADICELNKHSNYVKRGKLMAIIGQDTVFSPVMLCRRLQNETEHNREGDVVQTLRNRDRTNAQHLESDGLQVKALPDALAALQRHG